LREPKTTYKLRTWISQAHIRCTLIRVQARATGMWQECCPWCVSCCPVCILCCRRYV